MSEFRWLLFAAGLAVFALVFWLTRREAAGKPALPAPLARRKDPSLDSGRSEDCTAESADAPGPAPVPPAPARIVTVRVMGQGSASFSGEILLGALTDAGLKHGRFGIFHRLLQSDPSRIVFSVASLVEPGTFNLSAMPGSRVPGVSFFLALPAACDGVAAFDDMMSTARALAVKLDGQLLDELGSRLSVQRERFLREEVIAFHHKVGSS